MNTEKREDEKTDHELGLMPDVTDGDVFAHMILHNLGAPALRDVVMPEEIHGVPEGEL